MLVKLAKTKKEKAIFYQMYREHQIEMQRYENEKWRILSKNEIFNEDIIGKGNYLIINNDDRIVGFVTYQDVFWENIIYIENIYIKPSYRRQKYGEKTISLITESQEFDQVPKTVFLYIFKNNNVSHMFWKRIQEKLKWRRTTDDRCELEITAGDSITSEEKYIFLTN